MMAAQDELELLDRVFLRIGSAESDEQLENVVCRFLPPVLLKLSSSQEGVRKKVLELLVHVNKRLKSRPQVQIPVESLLLQYQDPSSITFVTNFTILYLKMGFPRLEISKQAELAHSLIKCLEGKPPLQQDSILQMLVPTLPHLKLPDDPTKKRAIFGLSEKVETIHLLTTFLMDYLLLPYTFSEERPNTAPSSGQASAATPTRPSSASQQPTYQTPPGLSPNALKRLIGEHGLPDANTIEECKVGIVRFLSADVLSETDVVCHLIVASSDTRYSVATAADVFLKKIHSGIDWNDMTIVRRLYTLFQGSVAVKGQPTPKQEDKRSPVGTRTRLKLFPYLLRSRLAADQFPACVQVIFDCLYGANSNNKLKSMAVQFVHHLCAACSDARMQPMGPILLSGMVKLIAEAKDLKEQACITLGYLPVGDPNFKFTQAVLEGLIKSANSNNNKQMEIHFSVGDAISQASLGALSRSSRDVWMEEEGELAPIKSLKKGQTDWVEWILNRILNEEITSQNHHKRQASCFWLLSVAKKCGSHPSLQKRLVAVQAAFIDMLSENSAFTQDVASKGLSVVYEQSSEEEKKAMVNTLVDTLATGKRSTKKNVTADTKVFEEGTLGANPEGGGLSTYRELCSLASDLNQPDLIYKFMHLANHNAMWTSRKGAAFGFGTIAAQAGEQLKPYLSQIVPKLFRYLYDPNGSVRAAMTGIWANVLKDNKTVMDIYLKEIIDDLLTNITSSMWRNRESSCLALSDLLRGRNVDDIVESLPELWEKCFLVLDDIKESVRKAAEAACRSLSKVCVKMCDINYGKIGQRAISLVLPCLFKGLPSRVTEVRTFSLSTLVAMSKNAGDSIKPHIPQLVTALLEALSGLEPQVMNYISLHVGNDKDAQEKLDVARIDASKSSPMMETIRMCVQYVDSNVLNELAPRVNDLIRSGIGVGTKAGCANFLILLSNQCPQDLTPHAGKLLSSLLSGLNDKSMAVRKLNASAIGNLIKVAKDSSVEKLILRLKTWFLEKDDADLHEAMGTTLLAMAWYNPDILKRHAAVALPLAFLAMHQKKEPGKDCMWEGVWLDMTPGTEGGIRLYLSEIVTITKDGLSSSSWPRKAQAARAMGTVATKLGAKLQPPQLGLLLGALLDGLQGRTWDGKDELLKAISTVCISCKTALQTEIENQPTMDTVLNALFKESRKERVDYKMAALDCLASVLQAHEADRFKELTDILYPIISKKKSEDGSDEEDVTDRAQQDMKLKLKECAFINLGLAWPSSEDTQEAESFKFCQVLCEGLEGSTFKIQLAIVKSLHRFLQRIHLLQMESLTEDELVRLSAVLEMFFPAIYKMLGIVKYAAIRKESLAVLEYLMPKLAESSRLSVLTSPQSKLLQEGMSKVTSDADPAVRERAAILKKFIKESFVFEEEEEEQEEDEEDEEEGDGETGRKGEDGESGRMTTE
nr:proteasome adapter and scaffold protein ECM29-like [Lytechinus pictus]